MDQSSTMSLPTPVSGKVPLKVNAFEAARQSNTQLLPLFPYLGPGDIVPCCAALESQGKSSTVRVGYFLHLNDVDEVAVSYGSTGQIRTGDVFVGPREHGVGGDADDPFFAILTITQRQLESGEQKEAIAFTCEKCGHELFRHKFSSFNEVSSSGLTPLPTIMQSAQAAALFNASVENRICKSCGQSNPEFPLPLWGWSHYAWRTSIAERALASLQGAAQ